MTNQEIAQYLDDAAQNAVAVPQIAKNNKLSLENAYKVQRLSIDERKKRGEEVVGYKLGFTSYAKMEQMGVHDLIWGILTDQMIIQPQQEIHLDRYVHPRAEPEIAFRVSQDITKALSLEELPDYIDKMAVAIEVIDSRYKDFKFSLEDVVADNCSSTGFAIGEWKDLKTDLTELKIALKINDQTIEQGQLKAILNNPLQPIVELSRLTAQAGLTVKKGHVIMAGAATAATYLKPQQSVSVVLEKLGEVGFKVL